MHYKVLLMKQEQDYIRDIAEIRAMMERSSKFLSLSGWAGIMAGFYALAGAWVAYAFLGFNPEGLLSNPSKSYSGLMEVILLALIVLVLAIGTAVFLSYRRAGKKGEKIWNPTAKRLLIHMAVPLIAGGILLLILIFKGMIGFLAPFSLIFYGLALYNAARFSYEDLRFLGLIQIGLGLFSSWFLETGLLFWALGFGVVHIIYGIHMNNKYGR